VPQRQAKPNVIALVGNKIDLVQSIEDSEESGRQVSTQEAMAFANEAGLLFFEASARNGYGVQDLFMEVGMNTVLI
jgi:Ras-related protein Rab-5C